MSHEVYLGDGLYARYDGQEIRLRAPREGGDHEVCLDMDMFELLQKIVKDYDPTPADDGRAWPQADNE